VRDIKRSNKEVFMPLVHNPGEAQVDFGYALAKIAGYGASGSLTTLYRSVGITAGNLNTDSRTVEISGSTATFSGDMPNHVGVGDVLAYNNGSNRIAFIHGRSSATVFTVKDKDGGTPAAAEALTSVGVYRAYTSLKNWGESPQTENANITEPTEDDVHPSMDLVAANTIMMVACYGDGEDAASVYIDDWTTGPDNYIKIYTPVSSSEVGTSQRHNGRWDTSAYRISMDGTYFAIGIGERYVRIDGLQIDSNVVYNNESNGIRVSDDNADAAVEIHIFNSIFRMTAAPLPQIAYGICILNNFGDVTSDNSLYVAKVWNNIIYGYAESDGAGTCMYADDYGTVYAYNNTCVGGNGATSKGIAVFGGVLDFYAKNNISIDSNDPYQNGFHTDSTNNISDTGDAPGSNPINGEPTFVNKTGNNYHLASGDTVAQGAGADLDGDSNIAITDDIDGDARNATQPDIGADEYSATVDLAQIHYRWRNDNGKETAGSSQVEVDDASDTPFGTVGSISFSHDVTSGGSNRFLLVGVSINNNNTSDRVSTVVWKDGEVDEQSLEYVDHIPSDNDGVVEIYKLDNPNTGIGYNITITFSRTLSVGGFAGAVSFTGVDLDAPLGTPDKDFAQDGDGPITLTVDSETGGMVFDTVSSEYGALTKVYGDQTQHWNGDTGAFSGAASTRPGATSVTMSWTLDDTSHWAAIAVPIKPASGGGDPAATFAKDENVKYTNLLTGGTNHLRLRFLVSNESTSTQNIPFELQVAEVNNPWGTECATATYYAIDHASEDQWILYPTGNIDPDDPTSNIEDSDPDDALPDSGSTFIDGYLVDNLDYTGSISLQSGEFTEIEFSVQATTNATDGDEFCFRLGRSGGTSLDSYAQYALVNVGAGATAVTLTSFSAKGDGNDVKVEWETALSLTTTVFTCTALLHRADPISV
jgi:hypothetical protein